MQGAIPVQLRWMAVSGVEALAFGAGPLRLGEPAC
jgi:hypothetical protein